MPHPANRPSSNVEMPHRVPFYTVAEAARLLRVASATLYRALREDAFPGVRIRSRYVIPAAAIEQLMTQATETGCCIDVARIAAERRLARELARPNGNRPASPELRR
jgi:excisionase family DNA binding protein